MLFSSAAYGAFVLGTLALYWLLCARFPSRKTPRKVLLLAASYFFYATWNTKFLALVFFTSTQDYLIGRALGRAKRVRARRALLAASVGTNLAVLCAFKYFDFFADSFVALLGVFGITAEPWHLGWVLPVGISFYTFQTINYVVDVYRGRLEPTRGYFDYLLFVAFFPNILMGPIARASNFLPQLAAVPTLLPERASRALLFICLGLVKKIGIADVLGAHLVNPFFTNPEMYSAAEALAAVYGYTFQIYVDFSAYSDIAIGVAALFGFELPKNFDAPYVSASLREFWHRWHISLSSWLRDYLYIPLGGSRHGALRTYLALVATMFLGGLWHGPSATFVVWGLIHGTALVATRIVQRTGLPERIPSGARRVLGIALTFHVVAAAWIFFRAPNFDVALDVFVALGSGSFGVDNIGAAATCALALALATHGVPDSILDRVATAFHKIPAPAQAALFVAAVIAVRRIASVDVAPFIYSVY